MFTWRPACWARPSISSSSVRILLVEPWLAGSHQAWAEGYAATSSHTVTVVGCPGEHWRWRLDGSALPLARMVAKVLRSEGQPDLVLVSGMTDVARLRGLLVNQLDVEVPVAVYQHESQLVYPHHAGGDRGPAVTNWMSWLAADVVFFNSEYHRQAVVNALPAFLDGLPDESHRAELDEVLARFEVLPLGIDLTWAKPSLSTRSSSPFPVIVWPHRWEEDKDPLTFGRALDRLTKAGLEYRVVLAGDVAASSAELRNEAVGRHQSSVLATGPFTTDNYRRWLGEADLVVSCARHDFFGAAVIEAVAAGCRPVVPSALAYPETLGVDACYQPGRFGSALEAAVRAWHEGARSDTELAGSVQRHCWRHRAPEYDDRLSVLAAAHQ